MQKSGLVEKLPVYIMRDVVTTYTSKGYYVTIAVPSHVKRYKKSCGYKSKDDNIDATALAYMGLEKNLDKWEPMNSFYYELAFLDQALSISSGDGNGTAQSIACRTGGYVPF